MNIYIGNLNYRIKESELQELLSEYGAIRSIRIIKDRETGRSKGFAFVEMDDDNAASAAISALNGAEVMGRPLVMREALQRT